MAAPRQESAGAMASRSGSGRDSRSVSLPHLQSYTMGHSQEAGQPAPENPGPDEATLPASAAPCLSSVSDLGQDSPAFRRTPNVCDLGLIPGHLLEFSTCTEDQYWNAAPSRAASQEHSTEEDDSEPRSGDRSRPQSSEVFFSRVIADACTALVLPDWPELDPAAFERGKELLGSMEMDPVRFSRDDLCHLALEIFEQAGLPEELSADLGRVRRFILAVRESMYNNAYHNFNHVFDVTQTVSVMARRTGTLDRLNAWERFALLAAALCHDLEHPGVSSVFLDRAGSTVAGAFKHSVLEKHHVLRAFEVMVGQDIGLLKGLSSESYWVFRNAVAGCILATDFAKHSSYREQVCELLEQGATRTIPIQLEMELILKCADISNVLKPFPIARRWALCVTDEFFHQGDVERTLGMPVLPSNDRRTQSRVDSQILFIQFVCAPFFESIATLYPGLRPDVDRMHENSETWKGYTDMELEETRGSIEDFIRLPSVGSDPDQKTFEDLLCLTAGTEHDFFADPLTAPVIGAIAGAADPGAEPARLTPGLQIMVERHQESLDNSARNSADSSPRDSGPMGIIPEAPSP